MMLYKLVAKTEPTKPVTPWKKLNNVKHQGALQLRYVGVMAPQLSDISTVFF